MSEAETETAAPKPRWRKLQIALAVVAILGGGGYVFYQVEKTGHSARKGDPKQIVVSGDATLDAIRKGIEYLKVHQEDDGEFSKGLLDPKPAFTALVVDAIVKAPDGLRYETDAVVRKACDAILSHKQPDGGLYTPTFGLGNYCTSISIMALQTADAKRFAKTIEQALVFVRNAQLGKERGPQAGGFGYGDKGGNADLSNTVTALEAMRQAGVPADDPAYKAAAAFAARCQNNSETNKEKWVGDDGGFIYRPENSKAGEVVRKDGTVGYKSYGLMSYAGLMSLLHAYVGKDDARVKAARRWVGNNYNLDNNVNLGKHGLYYYYLVMAKALHAYGERYIVTADGVKHDWPVELAAAIVARQGKDGSWRNVESERWMESDSVLVTAYMVRALTHCHEAAQGK